MAHKRLLIVLVIALILLAIVQYIFANSETAVSFYGSYIFLPFQLLRNVSLGIVPVSIGDTIYIVLTIVIISLIIKWIYYLIKLKLYRRPLLLSLYRTALAVAVGYILFFIGWGGNYSKPSIAKHWGLEMSQELEDDSALVKFDLYLIDKMNEYAPRYVEQKFKSVEKQSRDYYKQFSATKDKRSSLKIKPSLFGNLLEYSGIQGYYNPFTGEGQINKNLPDFLLPFTTCHEMAHQTGIAAEDDANFLAFVVCTNSNDPAFIYSAYFNIWLYANGKLRSRDSVLSKSLYKEINPITMEHIYTLRRRREEFKSPLSKYSGYFYDNFLKLNKQEKGMESYDDVVNTVYVWEQKRLRGSRSPVSIP